MLPFAILLQLVEPVTGSKAAAVPTVGIPVPLAVPEMLPSDHGPLPLAVMLGSPHSSPPPPTDTTAAPSSAAAAAAVRAALARCNADGVRLGVAVVDAAGNLRAAGAADGAMSGAVFVAARKATAAAAFSMPTSLLQTRLRADPDRTRQAKAYMAVSPGAVPLIVDGHLIGAVGGSGGSGQQDEVCAAAGAAAAAGMLEKAK